MATENPGVRLPGEFSFESYVERQFAALHERLDRMTTLAEQLGIDEQVLATAIPALAAQIADLDARLTAEEEALQAKVDELTAKEAEVAADEVALASVQGELAAADAELAAIQRVAEGLAPVVAEAEKLAPPAPAPGGEPPAGEGGEPVAVKALYTFDGDPATAIDGTIWPLADVQTTDGRPLYTFSGDTPGGPPTGAQEGTWTVYEGATEPVAAGGEPPAPLPGQG